MLILNAEIAIMQQKKSKCKQRRISFCPCHFAHGHRSDMNKCCFSCCLLAIGQQWNNMGHILSWHLYRPNSELFSFTQFSPNACVSWGPTSALQWHLFTLTVNQILQTQKPTDFLCQIKKKNAVVSFLNPRFLSSLQQQLQTSLCIWDLHYKYPLYSSATDQANYMDKRGINSNNLYDCAFYKLLFHHCHRNIWMPANRTSNDVTNFGHGELTLSRGFSRIKTEFCLPVFHVHTSLCYY